MMAISVHQKICNAHGQDFNIEGIFRLDPTGNQTYVIGYSETILAFKLTFGTQADNKNVARPKSVGMWIIKEAIKLEAVSLRGQIPKSMSVAELL